VTRVAVCDLGTNSTRLLVADVAGRSLVEIDRRLTITRLGEGLDAAGRLGRPAMTRVELAVAEYGGVADALGAERRLAVATSAVRDASNGAAFLAEIESTFGFSTSLLSGDEEARLTFVGVVSDRKLADPAIVVDLGGGSTELIVGTDEGVTFDTSLDIGCVRLTERHLHGDPPRAAEVEKLRGEVRDLLVARIPEAVRPRHAIGVAGTVTTLAILHLGLVDEDPALVHGHVLPATWIEAEAHTLARTSRAELLARRGIAPGRAPVIAGGALAAAEIVRYFELSELEVSERDILHGAALALAGG
jgi:exopolyphosphatase/guanosine-5'-triphosphate,3'-diphosphate pyrophosphatase